MELNAYALEVVAHERLRELRSLAERRDRVSSTATTSRPLRVALGLALIRLGSWALGSAHRSLALRQL